MVLGNVAIFLGSGFLGTVLGDGKIPSAGDVLSGAAKFVKKHSKEGGGGKCNTDPAAAQLLSQVNSLREEVHYLTSKPVTVVTNAATSGPGAYTITAVVVAGVIGYVYIKWKGWKLSDMMFVTNRGLSDACKVVGGQLDQVSDSVIVTRKHLAGRIDRVDVTLDETHEIIQGTKDEVVGIHGDLSAFQKDLQSVNVVVRTLESRLGRLSYSQDQTADGIHHLCQFTQKMEGGQNANVSSSIPATIGLSSERVVRAPLIQATCLPRPAPRLALEDISPIAESPRAETSNVSSAAACPRAEVAQEQQGAVTQTSWTREWSSESSPSSAEAPSSGLFGGLRLPGLSSFLRTSA
ncbi:hypothetical protein EJB05_34537 [Eragrostis curvula]|uniref:DUF1664 domain-containing protein n=1 Tax=Eragrostis curvula TaxID=38414 RepID=A0A5J9U4B1_9POAL|nr:hypothetical protein EJB05_34537 [Eragrostis curvula]